MTNWSYRVPFRLPLREFMLQSKLWSIVYCSMSWLDSPGNLQTSCGSISSYSLPSCTSHFTGWCLFLSLLAIKLLQLLCRSSWVSGTCSLASLSRERYVFPTKSLCSSISNHLGYCMLSVFDFSGEKTETWQLFFCSKFLSGGGGTTGLLQSLGQSMASLPPRWATSKKWLRYLKLVLSQ